MNRLEFGEGGSGCLVQNRLDWRPARGPAATGIGALVVGGSEKTRFRTCHEGRAVGISWQMTSKYERRKSQG